MYKRLLKSLTVGLSLFLFLAFPATGDTSPEVAKHIKILKIGDSSDRSRAAFELGILGPKARKAIPALINALEDEYEKVSRWTANTLGKIGPEAREAVPALIKATKHSNYLVRGEAATLH